MPNMNKNVRKVMEMVTEIRDLEATLETRKQALASLVGPNKPRYAAKKQVANYKAKHGDKAPALLLSIMRAVKVPMGFHELSKAAFKEYGMRKGTVSSTLFALKKRGAIRAKKISGFKKRHLYIIRNENVK